MTQRADQRSSSEEYIPSHEIHEGSLPLEDRLPERIFSTDQYPVDRKINAYSKMDLLIDILDILDGTPEYYKLVNSPLGSLFSLPARRCALAGKLVHNFLCRQVHSNNPQELWFTYGGKPLRFSISEFEETTGLPCQPYPPSNEIDAVKKFGPSSNAPYWYTLIGPSKVTTISDILGMLKADKTLPGWRRLQLILVVIVDGILLCATQPLKPTDEVVEMVKDTDFFLNRYPWGRRSFELTIEMVKIGGKRVANTTELVSKLQQESLVLHGCPISLQLFLFRSVPSLATLLPHSQDTRPFISRHLRKITKIQCYHSAKIMSCENNPQLEVIHICPLIEESGGDDARIRRLISLINAKHPFRKDDWSGGDKSRPKLCVCGNRRCVCGSDQTNSGDNDASGSGQGMGITEMSCTKSDKLEKEIAALRRKIHRDNVDLRVCILNEVRFMLSSHRTASEHGTCNGPDVNFGDGNASGGR